MSEVFGEHFPVARKEYHCDASEWLMEYEVEIHTEFSAEDAKLFRMAKDEEFKILPGSKYRKYNYKDGGNVYWSIRERMDIHKICKKYQLYPDI